MALGHGTVVAVLCSPDTASRVSRASEPPSWGLFCKLQNAATLEAIVEATATL